jgi:hypothetical protein
MRRADREFIREQTAHFERAIRVLSAEIRADVAVQREENRRYFELLTAQAERASRRIDDLIDESRAQRRALLHILDRLENGGTAPAA